MNKQETLREHYLDTCCQRCEILQHCKSIPECDILCKANFDNGRVCFCGKVYVDNETECPYFKEIR